MTGTQENLCDNGCNLLLTLLFLLLRQLLRSETILHGSRLSVRVPSPGTPLHVTFTQNRLSLRVQNAPLKIFVGGNRSSDRTLYFGQSSGCNDSCHSELSQVEVEPALQEILRRAGIANAAWAYRKNLIPSGKADEWELARLTIVAEGHGSSLAAYHTVALQQTKTRSARKRTEPKKQLSREQFRDPKTNQMIDVAAHEVMVRFDPKMSPDEIQEKIERLHAEVISAIPQFGLYHLAISESDTVSSFHRQTSEGSTTPAT